MTEEQTARAEIVAMIEAAKFARLATLDDTAGQPFVSLIAIAAPANAGPITLISELARHTKNLLKNPSASMLIEPTQIPDAGLLTRPRVTLSGNMHKTTSNNAREIFLKCHPDASEYVNFADFSIWQIAIEEAYFVAGFGRIITIPGADLNLPGDNA